MSDCISRQAAQETIHKTIFQFFDACEGDAPMSDKDKLLLEVNKAICNNLKALEWESEKCGDLISRQDIEWHHYLMADGNGMYHDEKVAYKSQIDDLPSTRPENARKRTKTHECDCISRETHACDCISRQAALEILDDYAEDIESGNWGTAYSKARTSMCELPSVEPERKTGKWEWNQRTGEYECSECGCNPTYEGITPDVDEIDKYRFCRWCGAKMEVTDGT